MSGAGEPKDMEYDDDNSHIASPVASLVSSLAETPVSAPNSLPTGSNRPHKNSHDAPFKFPNPKRLWKSVHREIPSRRRQKLEDNAINRDVQVY